MHGLKELHVSLYHPRVCRACIHPVRCVVPQYHKKTDPGVTVGDPKLLTCLSAALGLRYFWTRFPRGNKAWPATAQRCCGLPAAFSSWKKERTCWPTALPGSPETKGFPKIRSSGSFQLSGKVSGCGAGPQEKQKPLQATKKRGAMEVPGCYSNFQVGSALGSKFLPWGPFGDVDLQHWLLLQGCIAVARGSMLSYNNKAALST